MAAYRFLTTWLLEAPREEVWDVLEDALRWPEWWRGVVGVEQRGGVPAGQVGSRYAIEWRSRIPYPVRFEFEVDTVDRPALMDGRARGELEGSGCWRLFQEGDVTAVTYDWEVGTTKRWMNAVAPVARPVFRYNHDVVMRQGGEGLARRLGARLITGS